MLKQIDNFSPKISLFYKGFERHSSSISGIITILTYLIIIMLGIIFSIDFLFKKNPTSFYYNRFISDVGIFSFDKFGIFHFIHTGEINNIPYDNRVINVIGLNEMFPIINENRNFTLYDHWIYEPCNNFHIGNLKDFLNNYNNSFYNGLCINKFYNKTTKEIININDKNFKYPIIKHGNSNPNMTTYGIYILRCENNSIFNKTNCYDEETSNEKAIQINDYSIYILDHYINVSNYHFPLENLYNKIRNQIVIASFTINNLNLKPLKLTTHSGIIMNINSNLNSFNFDFNEKLIIEEGNTGIYGSFYFWMQNQIEIYDRTYQKIQDISASISGISKLLSIIGYCLNYLIANIILIQDTSNDIFKKTEKFGKNTSTKGFRTFIKSNYSNIERNEFPFQVNKKQISFFNHKRNNNNSNLYNNRKINNNNYLYNNINDSNISKLNIKKSSTIEKKSSLNKITFRKILYHYFCCYKNIIINRIVNIRKKVLSEEKLFTSYYILGNLSDVILKKNYIIKKILK